MKHCEDFPEEEWKCQILIIIKRVTASLSICGCLIVLFLIWLFMKYRNIPQRMIIYLAISAFLYSVSSLLGVPQEDTPACHFEGFFITYTGWSVFLWTLCLEINLLLNIVMYKNTRPLEWVYHVICWAIPLVISCLPFIKDEYGPAGSWCWVKSFRWKLGIWYIPMVTLILIMLVLLIVILCRINSLMNSWRGLNQSESELEKEAWRDAIKPYIFYPIFFLVMNFFSIIHRIQVTSNFDNHPNFTLTILSVFFSTLIGVSIAIIFCLQAEIRPRLTCQEIHSQFLWRIKPGSGNDMEDYEYVRANGAHNSDVTTQSKSSSVTATNDAEEGEQKSELE